MNKAALIQLIVSALSAELDGYARSARSAQAEATDEQSKAENKYDTRGLEASYLARGQSRQAMETVQAMQQYLALVAPALERHAAIEVGAVVEVEHLGEQALYFLGPCAGGTEVVMDGRAVTVITPQSPLGLQLMGAKAGAQVILPGGRKKDVWKVRAVE
jgi:transcription elongation GreA/GreB family factor